MNLKKLFYCLSAFLIAVAFIQWQEKGKVAPAQSPREHGGLFLPAGFEAIVVADSIGPARHIAVNDNGDIYVKLRFTKNEQEGNVALRDTNRDGKADIIKRFGDYKENGSLANGMRIHNGYLYFSSELVIYRNKLTPGKLIPESKIETVLTDDHPHGTHWHITKPVAFDNNGKMYVPFGAPTNACQDVSRTPGGTPGIAGLNPCPELKMHGGIWEFDANKTGMTQKDGRKFATGIRSVLAMDWNDIDKNLFVVMHGRDDLHLLWPNKFTRWQSAVLPAEEFQRVTRGSDFGWPYCYYDHMRKKKMLAPEYGGDGTITGRCAEKDQPVMAFPGHWAPNDLFFYKGNQFPDHYKNGAFIAFHGSTNRSPYSQAGYFVCFVPFKNGMPQGDWEVFSDGFAGADPIESAGDAIYRPMGLAMGPDGSLYVSDSKKGKIWRIIYKGDKKNFGSVALAEMEKRKALPHLKTPHEVNDNLYKGKAVPGQKVYTTYCASCHQRNGKGDGNRFPPLAGSEWVTGDKKRLLKVVLNGLDERIEVMGKPYNSLMPAHNFLSDQDIAEVVTFVRTNLGNNSTPVSAAEVKSFRKSLIQTKRK